MGSLVLTRRPGEAVVLRRNGRQARIYVVSVEANVVRLAFEAERDVEIMREELLQFRPSAVPAFLPVPLHPVLQAVRHIVTILWHLRV